MKRLLLILALLGGLASAHADDGIQSRYNFAPPVTGIARDIYDLHTYVMVICVLIFLFVVLWMAIAIIRHRKSIGHQPAQFHESTTVEIIWTVVPFLIVVALAVPATKTVVAMKDTTGAELTIKATGTQWKWGYDYLKGEGEGIAFYSALSTPAAQIGAPGVPPTEARGPNYLIEVGTGGVLHRDYGLGGRHRERNDDQERHDGPDDLDRGAFMKLCGLMADRLAVPDDRDRHPEDDEQEDQHADDHHIGVQVVDVACDAGDRRREVVATLDTIVGVGRSETTKQSKDEE